MHELLRQQLELVRNEATGEPDLAQLLRLVSRSYEKMGKRLRDYDETCTLTGTFPGMHGESSPIQVILDNVKDAILTVNHRGIIQTFNPTGERMFGYAPRQIVGRTLDVLLPEAGDQPLQDYLATLAATLDDTHVDLAAHETRGLHRDGSGFPVEIAVSSTSIEGRVLFVVCLRDITERKLSEQAFRESEARNKALVDNAPEAIVVFDVEAGNFVDANQHALELFRYNREAFLALGPAEVSPERQANGEPSVETARAYLEAAMEGETPAFEWLHKASDGREIPCEVRLASLPSSTRRLVRGSITDISERKRAELIAAGEKRVLEQLAGNATLAAILDSLCESFERAAPGARCSVLLLDEEKHCLRHGAAPSLPDAYNRLVDGLVIGNESSAGGVAARHGRQAVTEDLQTDPAWVDFRDIAAKYHLRACWSTPIISAGNKILGTLAVYFETPRRPDRWDYDLMERMTRLAGIAIERTRAELALRESEARFRNLFENVIDGVYQTSVDGRLISANPALVEMLGFESLEELRTGTSVTGLYANPAERFALFDRLRREGSVRNYEYALHRKDGRQIVVLENARAVFDENGRLTGYEGTLTDITERKQAEVAIFEEKERAQVTLRSIADAVIATDASGKVDYMNPAAETLTGWELRAVNGCPVETVFRLINQLTGQPVENPLLKCLREGRTLGMSEHSLLVNRAGQHIGVQETVSPIRDYNGTVIGAVMVFRDACQDGRLRRQLSYQSSHDELTGLINRREFESCLSDALGAVRGKPGSSHVLLYLDLDQFKVVNDTCGHSAGDQLLKKVTAVLHSRVRSSDTVARLSGDEFGVLLVNCGLEKGLRVAENLRQAVQTLRFTWQGRTLNVGTSIGVVEVSPEAEDATSLMSAADVACYAAKEAGRNRIHVYEHGDADERHQEMQWVSRIKGALDDNRLELYFQPIVRVGSSGREPHHFELLLRMRDEDGEMVQPSAFIPAAERYNLMPLLDRWVIGRALKLADHSRTDGGEAGYMLAINLSGTSLNDAMFLEELSGQLAEQRLPPGALCFEITETAAIANLANAARFMRELKGFGCKFALDDFGSGLSSFAYLKSLPVDFLKIDGHFITNVNRDPVDRKLVEAVCEVGGALGIETIAERVETRAVMNTLAEIGVHSAQGYFIARPESVENFARAIRRGGGPRLRLA